jgi:hypothetical protein
MERADSAAQALRAGNSQADSGKAGLLNTRREVTRGWLGLSESLRACGRDGLAYEVQRFLKGMPPPRTDRETIAQGLIHHASKPNTRHREPLTR